jgi:unsaturated chondroitin disaccharide hydrolase
MGRRQSARRARRPLGRPLGRPRHSTSVAVVPALVIALVAGSLGALAPAAPAAAEPLSPAMTHAQQVASAKVAATQASVPRGYYPLYTNATGAWTLSVPRRWVAGMLPGQLWLEYQRTGVEGWRLGAESRGVAIRPYATDTHFHDVGFMFLGSDRHDWRLTGDTVARDRLLTAARSLATRYSPRVGMVRTMDTDEDFWVHNDTMMNVELLYWGAAHGGGAAMAEKASSHALRTIADFLRPDGSSYHLVIYNEATGAVIDKRQWQGYADESTWSRGQAWIIYGLAVAFRETGDLRFADGAQTAARYWIDHVPADRVPYWDFDAPAIPNEPRDSSAAAIVASAFIELGRLDLDPARRAEYLAEARATLESLSSPAYLSEMGEPFAAVLEHGTHAKMIGAYDHGTSWGDYYCAEALMRLRTYVTRLAGPDRYRTAVRASQVTFDAADAVVIASGAAYADALAASGLAGMLEAPVLLTRPAALPADVAAEVTRLGATRAVVVGGTAAVSEGVATALDALPGVAVERIAGADRYATAAAVAAAVAADPGYAGEACVVRGDDFADALALSPVAYAGAMPVLLTRRDALPGPTAAFLAATSEDTTHVVIAGGTGAVSLAVERAAATVGASDARATTRLAGADRYRTAVAIGVWALDHGRADAAVIGIATGAGFPDALAGGAAVGHRGGVLLMSRQAHLPAEVAALLGARARIDTDVRLFGGEAAVSAVAENELRTALPEQ